MFCNHDSSMFSFCADGQQSFEGWFQDLQLSVNECFENPESKTDIEIFLQRLAVSRRIGQWVDRYCRLFGDRWLLTIFNHVHQAFLKSKDAERRLEQLNDQLQRGSQQVPPQQLAEFTDWLNEQQEEVGTFRTHCHNRQKQIESLLCDLNRFVMLFCNYLVSL